MSELTDLEICKRIAEIEKLPHHLDKGMNDKFINTSTIYGDVCEYSPLTDDALCFQLMVKYNLSLIAPEREQEDWDCVILDVLTVNESPNRAICLAIIEAHKGQS